MLSPSLYNKEYNVFLSTDAHLVCTWSGGMEVVSTYSHGHAVHKSLIINTDDNTLKLYFQEFYFIHISFWSE